MAHQFKFPQSQDFPGNLKPTYSALYDLFCALSGLQNWEIPIHFRGTLEVDQSVTIGDDLTVEDNVTIGTTSADLLTVNAESVFVNDVTFQNDVDFGGWNLAESGDDLVWKDDGAAERVRFGDTSSTYALTATGNARVTGTMSVGSTLAVDGHSILGNGTGDVTQISGPASVAGSMSVGAALSSASLSSGTGSFSGTVAAAGFTSAGGVAVDGASRLGNTTSDVIDLNGSVVFRFSSGAGITLGTASSGRIKAYDVTLGAISIPYYTGH